MKNKLFKKIYAFLGVLVMLLPLALGSFSTGVKAQDADATPTEQKVVLTKFGFSKLYQPSIDNNGAQISDPMSSTRLNGVSFNIYNVTEDYWNSNDKENFVGSTDKKSPINTVVTKNEDGKDGVAAFSLPTTFDGKNAVYLFEEVKNSANEGYTVSPNFIVGFPVVIDGKQLDPVYIYAKNQNENQYYLNFKKIDKNSKVALKGAEFLIAQEQEGAGRLYAKATSSGIGNVVWTDDIKKATHYTSDDKGLFGITGYLEQTILGVKMGLNPKTDYIAIETKAPDGYEEITEENAKDFEFKGFHSVKRNEETNEIAFNEITNTAKGQLPHTSGMGIVLFVVAGAALLAIGAFAYKKQRA